MTFTPCSTRSWQESKKVITGGETIRAFVRVLGPRGFALYDSLNVIPVNTVEEMEAHVKSYIDLEIAKEGRKLPKEMKKEFQEGKRPKQRPPKVSHEQRHPFIHRPNREVYETFTPMNQDNSVVLTEMEIKDLATPTTPKRNDAPMGNNMN